MPDKSTPDDMKDLWRNQKTERPRISAGQLEHKARKLQKKARREVYVLGALALVLLVAFSSALMSAEQTAQRIGLGILVVWTILIPFQTYRILRPGAVPADAAVATSMVFYRRQLERHRDYHRYVWLWLVIPMLLGVGLYLSPAFAAIAEDTRLAPRVLPFFILLATWAVAFLYLRRRRLRRLRRKLDTLHDLEKEI